MFTLQSIKLYNISTLRCTCLLTTLLFQVLIFFLCSLPSIKHYHFQFYSPVSLPNNHNTDNCPYGKVYVYELPPFLNKELLESCNELDPWSSRRCNALSNKGFGPQATSLGGIVPENIISAWYWTDLYAGEVIFHERMLNYKCRTMNQDNATAFYIPFYVGLAVGKFLWLKHTAREIDFHSVKMLNWVENQAPWKRRNGSDHFILIGRLTWDFRRLSPDSDTEWGTNFLYMPLMKNVLRLTPERNVWDDLEISVPYPNPFHPRSESDIHQWQRFIRGRKRESLLCFVGGTRKKIKNDFREVLMTYCKNETSSCRAVDCSVTSCLDGANATIEAFLDSDFCLQPKGDGFTRRATFDCMLAGAIPVFFWKGSFENQYQWHLPKAAKTYSVFIDNKDVRSDSTIIRRVLEKYSREDVKKMREMIIDLMPKFLIAAFDADLGSTKDAFDIAIEGAFKRFTLQRKT